MRVRLAKEIQSARQSHGWTQERLAERAGVHWTTIGKVERGVQLPSLGLLAILAEALEIPGPDLYRRVSGIAPAGSPGDELEEILRDVSTAERKGLAPLLSALLHWKRGR